MNKPWIDKPLYPVKNGMKLNATDQSFEDSQPRYYIFRTMEGDVKVCTNCYKKYRPL